MNSLISTQFFKMVFTQIFSPILNLNLLKSLFFFLLLFSLTSSNLLHAETITWTGTTSTDWNTTSNWNTNTVPTANDEVFVNNDLLDSGGFMPVITSDVGTIRRIEFETETSLNIGGGGSLTIDGTGCSWCFGVYLRRDVTLTISANASLTIFNMTRDGIYNYKGSIVNDGSIHIYDVSYRGINMYNNGSNNVGIMNFTNNGDILVEHTGTEGIYSQIRKDTLVLKNHGTIHVRHTDGVGWYNYAYQDSAFVDIDNYGTVRIDTTGLWQAGIYNLSRQTTVGEPVRLDFDNYGTIEVDSTHSFGLYNYAYYGDLNFTNHVNATVDIQNVNQWGCYNRNRLGEGYTPTTTFNNYGTITIRNTSYGGIQNYSNGHNFIFNNHHLIHTSHTGEAGLYNYTDGGFSQLDFVNDGTLMIDTSGTSGGWYHSGLYNRARLTQEADTTSTINFTNNGNVSIDNTSFHGIYGYADGGDFSFTNNGNLNIENTERCGLFFNTRSGTTNVNNTQNIHVENAGYEGFYIYNRKNNENQICQTTFTNATTGNIHLNGTDRDGMYLYSYQDTTEVVNDGVITTNQTGSRGMNVYSDNIYALLDFTNNGTIEIDSAGTEGYNVQARRQNEANSPPTVLNFTNNGMIDVDSTKYEGFQTVGERGYVHFINGENGEIRIRRTAEFGWHSYLSKSEDTMNVEQLIENHGLIDIQDTGWSGMQHYNHRGDNHQFINQSTGTIRIKNTADKGLEIENYGNSTSYDPFTNFTNHGLIDIDNIPLRSIEALCNRGNTLNLVNYGTIDIFKAEEYGIFNYCYNSSTSYDPIVNFDNWGTVNIDSTGLAAIQNYCYQSKEVNFNQHAGNINITRSFDHGIVCYPLQYSRTNYHPRVHFNMDGGTININGVSKSGIYNYANRDTIEVNITGGTIDISNTEDHGIYNYSYDDWASLVFNNGGTINTDQTGKSGIYNHNYNNNNNDTTSLDFTNSGMINTNNSGRSGLHNFNRSGTNYTFNNSGAVQIQNSDREGLRNLNLRHNDNYSVTFDFDNSGEISTNTTFQEGIRTSNYGGDFTLDNTGLIFIQNANREGMENVSYRDNFDFTNRGTIHVQDSKNEDIYNSALKFSPFDFTNSTCAVIQVNGKIKNHRHSNFVNDGIIMTAYDGFNDNKGNFTNNGIIEGQPDQYFESYSFQNIDNQGTILDYNLLSPLTGTVGQGISNAITDPDAIYTVVGWFTDETLSTSAGTYNAGSNTFTPNVGVGEHTLFVQTTDNILGCTTARPVEVTINPVMMAEEEEIIVTLTSTDEEKLKEMASAKPSETATSNIQTDLQLFPNPFETQTNVQFQVALDDFVRVELYGIDGQHKAVLFEGYLQAGSSQAFALQAGNLQNGVYLLRMVTDKGQSKSLRMVIKK